VATNPFDLARDPLAGRVITGLGKVSLALKNRAWREAGKRGITPTQGQILALLRLRPGRGLRLQELADGLGVTSPTASDALGSLADKGLVRKRRSGEDARSLAATLTERGRREAERTAGWPDFMIDAVGSLDESEQEVFLRLLVKVIGGLQERGQIPLAQMCVDCRFFRPDAHPGSDRPHHCAFVDAPFGNRHLRIDCPEQEPAPPEQATRARQALFG
jgi:DNA-binding MarR family transcriptional regulator